MSTATLPEPVPIGPALWELPADPALGMRVPARILADDALLARMRRDRSVEQLCNVTTLPGIARPAIGMPDMHEGYGFPVGGVAATRLPDGVISPGGIGFDINCGVRLLATGLVHADVADLVETLVHDLMRSIPVGYGRHGRVVLDGAALDRVLVGGAAQLVADGFGRPEDLDHLESRGTLPDADPATVSDRAKLRGRDQLGTLGGGNHFLEVQVVDEVLDEATARAFGLRRGEITVLLHTGSRGLGHQVCSDHVRRMDAALVRHGITLPDRQLACAPFDSPEGAAYFGAMCAAANFAWANRQVLTHRVREVFRRHLGDRADVRVVYDVAHNIAKKERYGGEELCVHRKGATRAFGPSSPELPAAYRGVGQPVFVPGSMGTSSFVLAGEDRAAEVSLASACHGAGRAMSRGEAKRTVTGAEVRRQLEARGIVVRCPSNSELAEEAPLAYKDVDRVVDALALAGVVRKVARLRPVGVLKG
jgi:tRNA-splicing ligase RtcB